MHAPIALSEDQMLALMAAAHPLPPDQRAAFLEACAKELAAMPEVGDSALHRVIVGVQRRFFDPPEMASNRRPRWSRG